MMIDFCNHGEPWTDKEEGELGQRFDSGNSLDYMSLCHRRTKSAILSRLVKIGKLVQGEDGRYYRVDALWYDYRRDEP